MNPEPAAPGPKPDTWYRVDLPEVDYGEALALQHRVLAARIEGSLPRDVVLLLEHPPVFTLGRRGGREHLTVSEAFLEESGVQVVQAERGGFITFHGPGQLVAYPIVNLEKARLRVVDFVEALEAVMIRTAARFDVAAMREPLNRGVWVDRRKLGSVGICVRRGVSFHGLALNVNLSLVPFGWIDPCGLKGVRMTSLARERGAEVSMAAARGFMTEAFGEVFGVATRPMTVAALEEGLALDSSECRC
jgi:lipoate-protein ligase B